MSLPKKEGDAVASTSTSLGLSYQVRDGKLTYRITCDFSKEKSWGSLKTEYILAHEQAHFDITEIHARKLYEALFTYEFNAATFKGDIATLYNRIVKEKEDMQEAYDGQTDHSRKRGRQIEWLEKIDTLLADTDVFANYP
jgi:predicted secreted Zn-dependent protease